jgi:hypothetical protein
MFYNTLLRSLSIIIPTALIAFSFSFPTLSSQADENPANYKPDIERIEVYGQRSLRLLKKEIKLKSKEFFKAFNNFNDVNRFGIVCIRKQLAGTNFKERVCEPRFVRTNRAQLTATRYFSNDPSSVSGVSLSPESGGGNLPPAALSRIVALSDIARIAASQNKKFYEHVAKLMKENPELIEKYQEILDLQAAFAYKKANK